MGVEKNPRVRIYHLPLMVSNWRLPRPETTLHLDGMYRQTYSWLKNREKKMWTSLWILRIPQFWRDLSVYLLKSFLSFLGRNQGAVKISLVASWRNMDSMGNQKKHIRSMQSPAVSGGGGMAYLNRVDIGTGVIEFHLVMPRGCPHGNGGNGGNAQWAQWAPNKDYLNRFNASPSCWEVTFNIF